MPDTIQCPSCGINSLQGENCENCNSFLLRLTKFELVKPKLGDDKEDILDYSAVKALERRSYFRSLKKLYQISLGAGLLLMVFLYVIAFDSFSETELVGLSYVWVLCIGFGFYGIYTEKAVDLLLKDEVKTLKEGLKKASSIPHPPIKMLHALTKLSSPLLLSIFATLFWALLLFVFLVGVFPSL